MMSDMTHPGELSDEEILSSVRECIDLLRAEIAADEDSDDVPRELWQMVHGLTHLSFDICPDGSVDARALEHELLRKLIGPYQIMWFLLKIYSEQGKRSRADVLDAIDRAYLKRYGRDTP
jgi:hypothetical protein